MALFVVLRVAAGAVDAEAAERAAACSVSPPRKR